MTISNSQVLTNDDQNTNIFVSQLNKVSSEIEIKKILKLYIVGNAGGVEKSEDSRYINNLKVITHLNTILQELTGPKSYVYKFNTNKRVEFIKYVKRIVHYYSTTAINLTVNNINDHFDRIPIHIKSIVDDISKETLNIIVNEDYIRDYFIDINETIVLFDAVYSSKAEFNKLGELHSPSTINDGNATSYIADLADVIGKINTDLNKVATLAESSSKSTFMFDANDKTSSKETVKTLVDYASSAFMTYKTNYNFIDSDVPIESGRLTLVSAPGNHGKSLFMMNLCRNVFDYNQDFFKRNIKEDQKDAVVFVTLEDDIYQLTMRLMSIFGLIDSKVIKIAFQSVSKSTNIIFEKPDDIRNILINGFERLMDLLQTNSIVKIVTENCNFSIHHSDESTFSANDLKDIITDHKQNGLNVKMAFVDYVDVMTMNDKYAMNQKSEYESQGCIVQELRTICRKYQIPIISVTQNNKTSEDAVNKLGNSSIGDSYKKVRYSDNIVMMRQRPEMDIMADDVKRHITGIDHHLTYNANRVKDIFDECIIVEFKVTKAKGGDKDNTVYMIFCKKFLRYYDSWDELDKDFSANDDTVEYINKYCSFISDESNYSDKFHNIANNNNNLLDSIEFSFTKTKVETPLVTDATTLVDDKNIKKGNPVPTPTPAEDIADGW